jgi:hypothetical protein
VILRLAALPLRLRKRYLESRVFDVRRSRELDIVLAALEPVEQYERHRRRVRAELARFRAWCRTQGADQ